VAGQAQSIASGSPRTVYHAPVALRWFTPTRSVARQKDASASGWGQT